MSLSSIDPTSVWTLTNEHATVSPVPDLIELLGERIRVARDAAGLSQRELADRVHVDTKTVSRWENGRHQATRRNANRLADALGVGVEEIGGELPAPLGRSARADQIESVDQKFTELVQQIFERDDEHRANMYERLAAIEKKLDTVLTRLGATGVPAPQGELGRRATGSAPTPATEPATQRPAGQATERDTA